jgi:galacturonosyltransferase
MRVLILANNDVGLYKFRKEILMKFVEDGYEVHIALPQGEFIPKLEELGCSFIETDFQRRGMNPLKDFRLVKKYKSILKKIKPDVVLTYTIKPNIYGGLLCRLYRINYIVNITGLGTAIENGGLLSNTLLILYKIALKDSSQVFFQNDNNRKFFIVNRIVGDNATLIPGSGVNLIDNPYEEYPKNDGRICFLFVGRIMKDKGIEEFLKCAEVIKRQYPNTQFDIVGEFDEIRYKTMIERAESDGYVRYYGKQNDVHSFIKNHHATVLPSYHEGLSNVLLESAATGRPVLASDIPGCREAFDNEISGFGFEPQNATSLIEAVKRFINLPYEQKSKMGEMGREKMIVQYDRNLVIYEYEKQINKLKKEVEENV